MALASALALLAVLAQAGQAPAQPPADPLAGDPRLETRVDCRNADAFLGRALGQLAAIADDARRADAKAGPFGADDALADRLRLGEPSLDGRRLAIAAEGAPLGDMLRALLSYWPDLVWERRGRALILRPRSDPKAQQQMLERLAPRTDAQKELQARGLEVVAALGRLPQETREALSAPPDQGGVLVSYLPRGLRQTLGRLYTLGQQAQYERMRSIGFPPPVEAPAPTVQPLSPDAVLSLHTSTTYGVRQHSLIVRQGNGATTIPVFEPPTGPPPPDEVTRDPAVVAREEAERRDLEAKDARLDAPVTLKMQDAVLVDAIMRLASLSRVSLICDARDVRKDTHSFSFEHVPVRAALAELKKLYGFVWWRTKEGVLIVGRSAYWQPDSVTRRQAEADLVAAYSDLSAEQLAALARPDGMPLSALPEPMRRALQTYVELTAHSSSNGVPNTIDWSDATLHMMALDVNGRRGYEYDYTASVHMANLPFPGKTRGRGTITPMDGG